MDEDLPDAGQRSLAEPREDGSGRCSVEPNCMETSSVDNEHPQDRALATEEYLFLPQLEFPRRHPRPLNP